MRWNYPTIFYSKIFYLRKSTTFENVRRFIEITVHREVRITGSFCECDKLTISLSEDEIELDGIVQRAVVNETTLTTPPYPRVRKSIPRFEILPKRHPESERKAGE